jgi:hypothetical protein
MLKDVDVLEPINCERGISEEDPCIFPNLLASNSTSTRFSNSSDIASYNATGVTEDEEDTAAFRDICKANPDIGINPPCKRLLSDPNFIVRSSDDVKAAMPFDFIAYFNDFKELEQFPDDPEISDVDYFELNEKNLEESLALQFYGSWTVARQGTPEWKKHSEWKLFWREFLHEPNFECPDGLASCNYSPPTLEEIQRRFGNNRPLGRRVLFVTLILGEIHAYTIMLEVSLHPGL